jgi:hypothetical protein
MINSPPSGRLDIYLPIAPEITDNPVIFRELQRVYTSLRSIQAFCQYYQGQYTTVNAPPYGKGLMYFDTTLNKLRVGGATAWETVTSV